jgi:transposase
MKQPTLFGESSQPSVQQQSCERASPQGAVRLRQPQRGQVELVPQSLEDQLPGGHRARDIWAVVEKLDLSGFYEGIAAREGRPGRDATDPKLLVALWLYATAEAVGSAREVARRCESDAAFRWLCGGVSLNHHTLSDFRVQHEKALDALFTQVLAVLLRQGLVGLQRVAQDGTRVRAWAGAASFRRHQSLQKCAQAAAAQVAACKRMADETGPQGPSRQQAAAQRAAQERQRRIEAALKQLPQVAEVKKKNRSPDEPRVSTTDADARVMKMADGGFRPAYNVQLATDVGSRVVVGVDVIQQGTDTGQLAPMLQQVKQRCGNWPGTVLVDGGFTKLSDIQQAEAEGVRVVAPVPEPKQEGVDRYAPKPGDSPEVAAWRQRMGTAEAQQEYKLRAATAETVNADLKAHRGFTQVNVRGRSKVMCVALWAALTYNVLRWVALAASA